VDSDVEIVIAGALFFSLSVFGLSCIPSFCDKMPSVKTVTLSCSSPPVHYVLSSLALGILVSLLVLSLVLLTPPASKQE
jgi:hypothetical protein